MMMGLFVKSRDVRPGYWFVPKRFGFGSVPANAAGWAATFAYLAAIGLVVRFMPDDGSRITVGIAVTIGFLALVWKKTDGGWGWRWGD